MSVQPATGEGDELNGGGGGIILAIYAGLLHPAACTSVIKAIKGRDRSLHN